MQQLRIPVLTHDDERDYVYVECCPRTFNMQAVFGQYPNFTRKPIERAMGEFKAVQDSDGEWVSPPTTAAFASHSQFLIDMPDWQFDRL